MEEYLPLTYDKLNDFLKMKAEIELNEEQSSIASEIDQLKQLIDDKKVPIDTRDDFLMWFLRSKKHNVSRAFEQVQKYSYQRHNLMNYYGFIDFEKIKAPIEHGICGMLPKRDSEGRAILFLRPCEWKSNICETDDVLRALQAMIHFCMEFPASQISGLCFIFDNSLTSLDTLHFLVKYALFMVPTLSAFPGRFQKISIVNTNVFIRGVAPIVFAILPSKLKKRTSFLGEDKTVLPEAFHPSILPEEYGGTMGPLKTLYQTWIGQLKEYVPKLRTTNKYYKRHNTVDFPQIEETISEN